MLHVEVQFGFVPEIILGDFQQVETQLELEALAGGHPGGFGGGLAAGGGLTGIVQGDPSLEQGIRMRHDDIFRITKMTSLRPPDIFGVPELCTWSRVIGSQPPESPNKFSRFIPKLIADEAREDAENKKPETDIPKSSRGGFSLSSLRPYNKTDAPTKDGPHPKMEAKSKPVRSGSVLMRCLLGVAVE